MCKPLTLQRAAEHVGHGVEYRPDGRRTGHRQDKGVIKSVTKDWVFVAYAAGPDGAPRAKATCAHDLVLIEEDIEEARRAVIR